MMCIFPRQGFSSGQELGVGGGGVQLGNMPADALFVGTVPNKGRAVRAVQDIAILVHDAGFVKGKIHDALEKRTRAVELVSGDPYFFHSRLPLHKVCNNLSTCSKQLYCKRKEKASAGKETALNGKENLPQNKQNDQKWMNRFDMKGKNLNNLLQNDVLARQLLKRKAAGNFCERERSDPLDELSYLSAARMSEAIRKKELSPVEVMEHTIRRIEQRNPSLNAFVYTKFDYAMDQAKRLQSSLAPGRFRAGSSVESPRRLRTFCLGSRAGPALRAASVLWQGRLTRPGPITPEAWRRRGPSWWARPILHPLPSGAPATISCTGLPVRPLTLAAIPGAPPEVALLR